MDNRQPERNFNSNDAPSSNGLRSESAVHGIAMGTAAGSSMADLAVDCPSEFLHGIRQLPRPSLLPPDPLLRVGVSTIIFLQRRDRAEI
jgi:hypothetical protein